MKKSYRVLGFFLLVIMMMAGCSDSDTTASDGEKTKMKAKPKQEVQVPEAPKDIEGILKADAGEMAGKTEEELAQKAADLPKNLSADEYFNHLVMLAASDYKEADQRYDEFNPEFKEVTKEPEEEVKPRNVVMLLDSSGSMNGKVGGKTKMELAKSALDKFASKASKEDKLMLRIYGHKGTGSDKDKKMSCQSNKVVYPLSAYNPGSFKKSLTTFQPAGWTPLAESIKSVQKDLKGKTTSETKNVVYIISDGIETCGGDPVQKAKNLHQSELKAEVNIIGFDVDDEGQAQLKKAADAGGGTYKTVRNAGELNNTLGSLLDQAGRNIQRNLNIAGASINAGLTFTDKTNELRDIQGQFIDAYGNEYEAFNEMATALVEKKRAPMETVNELREKLNERRDVISGYNEKRYRELVDRTQLNLDELHDELDKMRKQKAN